MSPRDKWVYQDIIIKDSIFPVVKALIFRKNDLLGFSGFQLIFLFYDPSFGLFPSHYNQLLAYLNCSQIHHSRNTLFFHLQSPRVVTLIICNSTYYLHIYNNYTVTEHKKFWGTFSLYKPLFSRHSY